MRYVLDTNIAMRHDAVIVSDDNDFDSLPIRRENWRKP
jgi:predicted nuclease of predicted toxin-antitoxin system